MSTLTELLSRAAAARAELIERLAAEDTNCYRLFHGSVEGASGLTVDRYGEQILVQSFHQPLSEEELAEIRAYYRQTLPELALVYNDRSESHSRIRNALPLAEQAVAEQDVAIRENGVAFHYQARHKGQDPWLFLDLRAARRRVMQLAEGKSVLNLFSYTCGVGVAAAKAGASFVLNVDFAESSLSVGRANAKLNLLATRPRCLHSDVFAALRQLSGLGQAERVRGKKMPPFPKLEARQFDLVFLDPPRYSKSPFGVVDLVNDYQALFKPALLATAAGGALICCNNVAEVNGETWLEALKRSAAKAGREVRAAEWIAPDADFPSADGKPPLKIVLLHV
ncbi:class I SAM-dependent methyltransferase [Chromobacterium subtsugae]|uniref:Class I SAM-dependent methyltransferase n=1 Tax=Chromobacterium subtsugae TaxID=251747 RepID=A0ABS7FHH0_9NEIS|nr:MULTISPECIES: class I SAM-dependent methyltransferase [Chromobacterium]KUM02291.1 SAM-dependent methyltransferase [Chromobacterium subtsugae]KZE86246.1 SAM-dependent methyltransferase [Chromobacterium sp. F49]MBW7568093.1 class I SAM-dependent methyltransferase [Chromobacterium subtsugae]MBW8289533.1 class I SAM-dependent methyltransferase [Chromobacterium subtsugae]OBU86229.1 SAM-dependent methyltransferase [Chromobacterium subtsugae]